MYLSRASYKRSSTDSDDEWGWDGEDDNTNFAPPKSTELPVHRAQEASSAAVNISHESPQTVTKSSVRGMSLKGATTAQPLTHRLSQASKARQPAATLPQPSPASAPIVKPPRPDDFFAEMGLATGPSSISNATSTARWSGKSLGATPLPSGSSDLGEDDWNDDDLDDLLNE
jgi:hypothetical protein